jgi:hypothetical protein
LFNVESKEIKMKLAPSIAALVLAGFISMPASATDTGGEAVGESVTQEQQADKSADVKSADATASETDKSVSDAGEKAEPKEQKMVCKYVKTSTSRLGRKVCSPAAGN